MGSGSGPLELDDGDGRGDGRGLDVFGAGAGAVVDATLRCVGDAEGLDVGVWRSSERAARASVGRVGDAAAECRVAATGGPGAPS